jgi:type II secretory pathway component PulC
MRPHLARRLAACLWAGGALLCLVALSLTVYLALATLAKPGLPISTASLHERTPTAPCTLASFQDIWTAPIIEDAPPAPPAEKPQPQPKPLAPPVTLPLAWVGAVVHSDPARSVAILLDKLSNRQLLLRLGSTLPDSPAKVVEITRDHVKFQVLKL